MKNQQITFTGNYISVNQLNKSQTKVPFNNVSNTFTKRGDLKNLKITRFGHASKVRDYTRINNDLRSRIA
jgi:hypothetical protein